MVVTCGVNLSTIFAPGLRLQDVQLRLDLLLGNKKAVRDFIQTLDDRLTFESLSIKVQNTFEFIGFSCYFHYLVWGEKASLLYGLTYRTCPIDGVPFCRDEFLQPSGRYHIVGALFNQLVRYGMPLCVYERHELADTWPRVDVANVLFSEGVEFFSLE